MKLPGLSRRTPSLDRRGPNDPEPPLPAEPLYVSEPRGDDLPSPPFTDQTEGLDAPAPPRPAERAPSLSAGSVVGERAPTAEEALRELASEVAAEMVPIPLMNAAAAEPRETGSPDRGWSLRLQPFGTTYPSRIYEVRDITGLRWERLNGRGMWVLHYDKGVVTEELPAWLSFGPHGEDVASVIEQVACLSLDRVRALPVPTGLPLRRIPVDLLPDPVGSPLREAARLASSTAMVWTENRGWAIDAGAGGHYYQGCYFVYNLDEPHWLSAMGRAMNAAILAALGADAPGPEVARVRGEWAELVT